VAAEAAAAAVVAAAPTEELGCVPGVAFSSTCVVRASTDAKCEKVSMGVLL
jgi:hypothetical protein